MAASRDLQRFLLWPLLSVAAVAHLSAQELPKKDNSPSFDFEPKLMLNDVPYVPLPAVDPSAPAAATGPAPSLDVAKLEAELDRAKKNAAWRERLFKAGVLSKVEAEQGALKIVRISRDLENARVQALTRDIEEKKKQAETDPAAKAKLTEAEASLATTATSAAAANARWDEAQRAAAELRLQRERKLLAVGAGSRSSVKRAEAALQVLAPAASSRSAQ